MRGSRASGCLKPGLELLDSVRRDATPAGVPATKVRKRIQTLALLGPALALVVLSSARSMATATAVTCMTTALAFKSLGEPSPPLQGARNLRFLYFDEASAEYGALLPFQQEAMLLQEFTPVL